MKRMLALLLFTLMFTTTTAFAGEVGVMDKDTLKAQLGAEDLVILDVRTGKDWSSSEFKIKGAIRTPPGEFDQWSATYPKDKTLVLYCA